MTPPTARRLPHTWMNANMLNDNDRFPVRKRPRLKDFDYSSHNYYFVTACTRDKACLFGSPDKLSRMGHITADCLQEIELHFPGVTVDKWVVMPNHIHAIIILPGNQTALPAVIGQYKAAVTKKIRTFYPNADIWQSSFHDHVIRNQADYQRIWAYIDTNPAKWMDDCFYIPQPEQ